VQARTSLIKNGSTGKARASPSHQLSPDNAVAAPRPSLDEIAPPTFAWSIDNISLSAPGDNTPPNPTDQAGRPASPARNAWAPSWPIQMKLEVGAADDPLEREADRVAGQVMTRMRPPAALSNAATAVQRTCSCGGSCEDCRGTQPSDDHDNHGEVQRKPVGERVSVPAASSAATRTTAPPIVADVLRSSGQPLDPVTRAFFEPHFGSVLSGVRLHADGRAQQSARDIQAQAYTVGRDIVFGPGRLSPGTDDGLRLLAHELAHVVQQTQRGRLAVQRQTTFFGPTAGAPANWSAQVNAAVSSADRAALLQKAVGLPVIDVTAASAADPSPVAAKLTEFSSSSQKVNYDENLNSKKSPVDQHSLRDDGGYTLQDGGKNYVILGPKAIDAGRYALSLTILNHELDHVQQHLSGSRLKGNEKELDAWTSSFVRDFHRTYLLGDTGSTCYVHNTSSWTQVLDYYAMSGDATQRDASAKRIKDYYNNTVKGNDAHDHAFKYWLYRALKHNVTPNLADRLNTELALGISASDPAAQIRQFKCGPTTKTQTYSPQTLNTPAFPSATTGTKKP